MNKVTGKILYGLIFCALLPVGMIGWAYYADDTVSIPPPDIPEVGLGIGIVGFVLIAWAMLNLWTIGKGLPMNAYRPKQFVTKGVYAFISNPIYVGACFLSLGISLYVQSAAGVWLVTPVFTLACIALVWGYEKEATHAHFNFREYKPKLSFIIPDNSEQPGFWSRFSVYALVLIPWVFMYETVIFIGEPTHPISTYFEFDREIPVYSWTEIFYAGSYVFVGLCPLVVKSNSVLRKFIFDGVTAVCIGFLLLLVLPFVAEVKPVEVTGSLSRLLEFEQEMVNGAGAFPSFHVIWILISLRVWKKSFPTLQWIWITLALIMMISCVTTGMHSVADILAGVCVAAAAVYRVKIWLKIKFVSEIIFHSRKDYRLGKVRIINHSIYAAIAAFTAAFIAGMFIHNDVTLIVIGLSAVIGAGLWGQFLEGSSKLLRPFGYYGSVVGVLMAAIMLHVTYVQHFFVVASAFAMAAPWAQAIGRIRCMVQGCCHGRKTNDFIGIKVYDEKSRICGISGLKGAPIHNTQLYSIISNVVVGLVLFRLWYGNMSAPFIAGMYLILNGLTRFVEEAFRGEIQTPVKAGLKVYQWLAIFSVVLGSVFTAIPFNMYTMQPVISDSVWINSALLGVFTGFAMGVDFPESNRRFSRLSG